MKKAIGLIIARKKRVVIVNKPSINGFGVIEIMIAILLFSIILLGFINYQQRLLHKHRHWLSTRQANQIAFQLLESYPQITEHRLPAEWSYNINSLSINSHCKMVFVSITLQQQKKIQQQRLFCD